MKLSVKAIKLNNTERNPFPYSRNISHKRKIGALILNPDIYPNQVEVGKLYVIKNEIIMDIRESELMIHIYTETSGIRYGTPICIYKKDIRQLIYIKGR
jgi:hypothetical protein